MPAALHYTDSAEANKLIAKDPMALLIGFVLDQQVTVQKAFTGPADLLARVGTLDAAKLADADLESVFREKPAIHRPTALGSWPSTSATSTTATRRKCGSQPRMPTS